MLRILQHPAVMILLCFSLSGTAVSYRGGASDAHPHMFLEFLLDASTGSFNHHHGATPAEYDRNTSAEHAHSAALDDNPQHGPAQATQPLAAPADTFTPSVSAFIVGDVTQLALLLPDQNLPQIWDVTSGIDALVVTLWGRTSPPIAPPPR